MANRLKSQRPWRSFGFQSKRAGRAYQRNPYNPQDGVKQRFSPRGRPSQDIEKSFANSCRSVPGNRFLDRSVVVIERAV